MKEMNNFMGRYKVHLFGLFKGTPIGLNKDIAEDFEEYKKYKNNLDKKDVIKYMKSLKNTFLAPMDNYDIFTNKSIVSAGFVMDGDFAFSIDFIYYYENYEIGIPEEYENYIKTKIK